MLKPTMYQPHRLQQPPDKSRGKTTTGDVSSSLSHVASALGVMVHILIVEYGTLSAFTTILALSSFPMFFFVCYALYSLLFPYLFMTSKSMATHYQMGMNVFWWLMAGERIVYGLTVIGASYCGGKIRVKLKWIGYGFLLIAAGCFVLSLTGFIAPLPVVEPEEVFLWKGIYIPASKQDIANPLNLMTSYWGKRFPMDVQMYLNETGHKMDEKMEMHNISKRSLDDNEIDQILADSASNLRKELSFEMEEEIEKEEKSPETRRLVKRQMSDFEFPVPVRDRLKEGFEAAVIGLMWFGDSYDEFAYRVYNLTNDQEIFERLMKAAGLPFGYCRNTSMLVRERLRTKTCLDTVPSLTLVSLVVAFLSVTMMGVGGTVVVTVGLPYIEDLVGWKNLPKYLVALACIHYIAAAFGLGLGKVCDMVLYSTMTAPPQLTPIDPCWVGAWWLGLLIIFVLMKIVSSLMIHCGTTKDTTTTTMNGETKTDANGDATNTENAANGTTTQEANGNVYLECCTTDQTDETSYTVNPKPEKKQFKVKGLFDANFEIFRQPIFVSLLFALTW